MFFKWNNVISLNRRLILYVKFKCIWCWRRCEWHLKYDRFKTVTIKHTCHNIDITAMQHKHFSCLLYFTYSKTICTAQYIKLHSQWKRKHKRQVHRDFRRLYWMQRSSRLSVGPLNSLCLDSVMTFYAPTPKTFVSCIINEKTKSQYF